MPYKNSLYVNLVINFISLAGGIGFYVLNEIYESSKKRFLLKKDKRISKFSIHSKLAIIMTIIIIIVGTAIIMFSEKWPTQTSFRERVLVSSFQTISASTTDGFNSIDISKMSVTSLFLLILLMFIGASPGSTGGGIKTTTLGVIILSVWARMTGKKEITFQKRTIAAEIIEKALMIFFLFMAVLIFDLLVLTLSEQAGFLQILFETVSALGNTGLSMGITASLSHLAKVILSITMFIGRVGPLTLCLAFIKHNLPPTNIRYSEEEVYVG